MRKRSLEEEDSLLPWAALAAVREPQFWAGMEEAATVNATFMPVMGYYSGVAGERWPLRVACAAGIEIRL